MKKANGEDIAVSIELMQLQTFLLSKNMTLIDGNGRYKSLGDVFDMVNKQWENLSIDEQKKLSELMADTDD